MILIIAITASFTWLALSLSTGQLSTITIPLDVSVDSVIGINTDTDALHFGKIPPGQRGERSFALDQDYPFAVAISIIPEGSIGPWTNISSSTVLLWPHQPQNVTITVRVPGDIPPGNYTGILRITTYRPLIFPFLSREQG
ncbi:MAG: hypothetical protein QS99_C0010G0006 [archaeon GW2011_AR4]|nr:MAG: hypothetical protein QS99_C0010G0006 [archaeon GW2011_AR4]